MEPPVLGQALALIAIIAAVGEYAAIIRRRAQSRAGERAAVEAGLRGLVRIEMLVEDRPGRRVRGLTGLARRLSQARDRHGLPRRWSRRT